MKKYHCLLNTMFIITVSIVMVSCDEDVARSVTLSGQWQGDFGMYYDYEYPNGYIERYNSYDTDLIFYPDYDYATYGYGKQVDWYKHAPMKQMYYRFYWEIKDGVIYIDYPYDHELDTEIYNYKLNDMYFSGRFGSSNSRFCLTKIADYYDWRYYNDDWEYYYWWDDDWGYYYTRSADASVGEDLKGTIIKRGNRFNDK